MGQRTTVEKYSYSISMQLLIICFTVFSVGSIALLLGQTINKLVVPVGYLASVIIGYLLMKKLNLKQFILVQGIVLALLIISFLIAGQFYDVSWDGMGYHQNAIIELSKGWNPIREKLQGQGSLWNNCYPKYPEIVQASILSFSGNIEAGKMLNFVFMLIATLYSFYILLSVTEFNYRNSILFSILIGFNPISVYQLLSFYNDGILASILIICGCMIIDLEHNESKDKYLYLIMIGCIGVNIKATLLGYIFIIGGLYTLYCLIKKKNILKLVVSAVSILIIGVGLLGYNPYMNNLTEGNHIFYPLMGKGKVDIITYNQPTSFLGKNRFEKLWVSLFAESDNINEIADREPAAKLPLTIKSDEIKVFRMTDTRMAGWGTQFSGILIIALLIYVRKRYERKKISLLLLLILITVAINPEGWWARYTPQLYLVPIIILIAFSMDIQKMDSKQLRTKISRGIKYILVALCILNVGLISYQYVYSNIKNTQSINNELNQIGDSSIEVYVKSDKFESYLKKLEDKGINYTIVDEMNQDLKWQDFKSTRDTIYYAYQNEK